jgi:integrase
MHRDRTPGSVAGRRAADGMTVYALRFPAFGKRQQVTLGRADEGWTRARAEEELANVLADVRRGIWQPPARAPEPAEEPRPVPTLHEFASEWFRRRCVLGDLAESTRSNLEWEIGHLVRQLADWSRPREPRSLRLDEIDAERVEDTLAALVKGGLSRSSARKIGKLLVTLLEVAVEYGHVSRNVAAGPVRRFKAGKPKQTALDSAAGIAALLDAAAERDEEARSRGAAGLAHALVAVLVFAGLRISEALALRWRDVDLAAGVIRVRGTKTAAAAREVDLLPALRDVLAALKARRDPSRDDLLFVTSRGTSYDRHNVTRRLFKPAVERANARLAADGLDPLPAITPHSLRRTYASVLVALGEDVGHVMDSLGHTDAGFTLSVYRKAMKRRDGQREQLQALVNGEPLPALDRASGVAA